jgi:16S rRNA (uracil1498-N3)-methyltransferase
MTPHCFFVEKGAQHDECIDLTGDVAHHARTVLRIRPGQPVELTDGCGNKWWGVVVGERPGTLSVRVVGRCEADNESFLGITLAVAYSRHDRMELALRQATELGIERFVGFRAQRSQYGLAEMSAKKRRERWLRIAREAVCQCGRSRVPDLLIAAGPEEFLGSLGVVEDCSDVRLRVLAAERDERVCLGTLKERFPVCRQVVAVIGPEGGWGDEEIHLFVEAGFYAVHLGPRTLRLETAAAALVAACQLLWGDGCLTVDRGRGHEM